MGTKPKSMAAGVATSQQLALSLCRSGTATCACPRALLVITSCPVRVRGWVATSGAKVTPNSTALPEGTVTASGVPADSLNHALEVSMMEIRLKLHAAPPSLATRTSRTIQLPGNTLPKSMAVGSTRRWQ